MEKSLGQRIKALREPKFSLRQFAEKIGMKPSQLSEIENGKQYPTEEKLRVIAKWLVVEYEELKKYEFRIEKEFRDLVRQDPEVGLLLRRVTQDPKLAQDFNRNYRKDAGDADAGTQR